MSNNIYALKGFHRASDFALDQDSLFQSYELAVQYVRYSKTCYPGQVISINVDNARTRVYIVQHSGSVEGESGAFKYALEEIGSASITGAKYRGTLLSLDLLYQIPSENLTEGDVYYVRKTDEEGLYKGTGTGREYYSVYYFNGADWLIKDIHLNIADEDTDGLMRMEIFNSLISKRPSHALFYSNSNGVIDDNTWVDMEVKQGTFDDIVTETPLLDEEGNQVLDENEEPVFETETSKVDPRDILLNEDMVIITKTRLMEMLYEMTSMSVDSELKIDNYSHWIASDGDGTVNISGVGHPIKQVNRVNFKGIAPIYTDLNVGNNAEMKFRLEINTTHLKINDNGKLAHTLNFNGETEELFYKIGFDDAGHVTSVTEVIEDDLIKLLTNPTNDKTGILSNLQTKGEADLDTRFYSNSNSWDKIPYHLFECNRTYSLTFNLNGNNTTKNIKITHGRINKIDLIIKEALSKSVSVKMRDVNTLEEVFNNDDVYIYEDGHNIMDIDFEIYDGTETRLIFSGLSDEDQGKEVTIKIEYYGRDSE